LAEQARKQLESQLTDDQYDTGIFYRITTYELGRVYA